MKKWRLIIAFLLISGFVFTDTAVAQCSICAKTASQMGEKPAKGMNSAIVYLMAAPFAIVGFIGWRWWKSQKDEA